MSLKILLDNPSDHPALGFEAYASALKRIIEVSDPQFSVGIFGGWGSGKTTLMRTIEKQLSDQIVSVWFNAWRYEKEEHLIIPLLDILRDELVAWAKRAEADSTTDSSFSDRAIKAASTIAKAARAISTDMIIKSAISPLPEGPGGNLDANKAVADWREGDSEKDRKDAESPQSPYHVSFKALYESLTEFTRCGKQRIVVFIDDLDRCLPSNALQVLESIKLFFDLEGFVFVVGLDQEIIEASIDSKYRFSDVTSHPQNAPTIRGADYIRKIFQVPFNLPAVSPAQLDAYLSEIFSAYETEDEELDSLLRRVRPHLDFLVGDSGVNPREIKRYINAYILQKLIQYDLDDEATLVLQTIGFRADWREAYKSLRSDSSTFIEAAKRQLNGEEDALKRLDPRLENLPKSFFDYMKSSAGQRLLGLDAPQLEERVRALEAVEPVEGDRGILYRLERIQSQLARAPRDIDNLDPRELDEFRDFFTSFREDIRTFEEILRESEQLINSERSSRSVSVSAALDHAVSSTLRSLKDIVDAQLFSIRPDGLGTEELEKFIARRGNIVGLIRELESVIAEVSRSIARRGGLDSPHSRQ